MSLASQMREAARELREFRAGDLADRMGVKTYQDRRRVSSAISDFVERGEFERTAPGCYRYRNVARRTLTDKIWQAVRIKKSFTAGEIEFLTGAARETILEYLHCLKDLGILRKQSRTAWMLVKDTGPETPVNTAKCKKLRRLRSKS